MAINQKISVSNPDLHEYTQTTLSQDTAVGATTLNVQSTNGFLPITGASDRYYVLIGGYGGETSEIVLASAKTDTTFTVGACKFSHSSSDTVTFMPYNQLRIYGRVISGGSNVLLQTMDLDVSRQETTYEYNGSDYSYFIAGYYNVDSAEESLSSEEISVMTFTTYSVKKIVEAGLRRALTRVDENQNGLLGWNALIDIVNDGLAEIMTRKKQWQCLHKVNGTISTASGVQYVEKPSDLSVLEFIYVNGKKIDYITKLRYNQYVTNAITSQNGEPQYFTIKNDKIYLFPTPDAVYSTSFEYYSLPETITSLAQEVKTEFATILTYFVAAQAAYIRNNEKRGNLMEAKFNKVLEDQVEDVTGQEQVGDAQSIEFTSGYGYDDDSWIGI